MSLPSLGLDAFFEVAKAGNFSAAAKALHVTQLALSQRIKNLEEELRTTLFLREKSGVYLTDSGEKLLRYCQTKQGLEESVLGEITEPKKGERLSGSLRLAGYSSAIRSLVMPALNELITQHPDLSLELMNRELREIPSLLKTGAGDLALGDREISLPGMKNWLLGHEENVLVESAKVSGRETTHLDHDSEDRTTSAFYSAQNRELSGKRIYLDEIYAIIDGVALGWGKAVVPRHLIRDDSRVRVLKDFKPIRFPIYLSYYESPFLPKLIRAAIDELKKRIPSLLKKSASQNPGPRLP